MVQLEESLKAQSVVLSLTFEEQSGVFESLIHVLGHNLNIGLFYSNASTLPV